MFSDPYFLPMNVSECPKISEEKYLIALERMRAVMIVKRLKSTDKPWEPGSNINQTEQHKPGSCQNKQTGNKCSLGYINNVIS